MLMKLKIAYYKNHINLCIYQLPKNKDDKILAPVIFYIHGGLFVQSSGDFEIYNPNMILDGEPGELVFVTFNYRLGPLGKNLKILNF